jgi:L-asparaginase II
MPSDFRVESTRGDLVESVHEVSVAVVDPAGRLVAEAGDPAQVTFWRSAAKPFQAMPVVQDGAARRFGFDSRELALTCASHSSEPVHREVAAGMLQKLGLPEAALACGPHPPLSPEVAEQALRKGLTMSPVWSNCSGKHAGMLALALSYGWPTAGYERREHPVQGRILREVERWTGLAAGDMRYGVDGCTVVCFALPLAAMAAAYARFGTSDEPAPRTLREAMVEHPELVAGIGRLETDLGRATGGAAIAKVGADGIFCAALPRAGLGIALKVADGDMDSSGPALMAVVSALAGRWDLGFDPAAFPAVVQRHAAVELVNTRGAVTGQLRPAGGLRFLV